MSAYIARRILLMIPTLLGILFVSFVVVQFAPGGPVERVIAQLSGADTGGTSRISGAGGDFRGRGGPDTGFKKTRDKAFRVHRPGAERFLLMVWNFSRFVFRKSNFLDVS